MIATGWNSFNLCGSSTLSSSPEAFSKFGIEAITELRFETLVEELPYLAVVGRVVFEPASSISVSMLAMEIPMGMGSSGDQHASLLFHGAPLGL